MAGLLSADGKHPTRPWSSSGAAAVDQARAAAGDRQVHVMGGADLIRQALAAGLVDELTIIIAPVTLGARKRLFDGFAESLELEHLGCASPGSRRSSTTGSRSDGRLLMARLIYSAIASADGYVEDAAGHFERAAPDEQMHR